MKMQNQEIRETVRKAGLRYWQIAAVIGINRVTLCEWMRFPLTGERKKRVQGAIQKLINERDVANG